MANKQAKNGKHSRSAVGQQAAVDDSSAQPTSVMEPFSSDASCEQTVSISEDRTRKGRMFSEPKSVFDQSQEPAFAGGASAAASTPAESEQAEFGTMNPVGPVAGFGGNGGGGSSVAGWTAAGDPAMKKERNMKKVGKVVGVIVGILVAVYLIGVFVFNTHFYPGSTMGGTDISLKSSGDVATLAESKINSYSIAVKGDGLDFSISADQAGLNVNGNKVAAAALASNNAFIWPYEIVQKHDETDYLVSEYNSNGLESLVKQKVEAFNATATDPQNATIAYSDTTGAFAVKAEQTGTKLDVSKVLAAVDAAVMNMESAITLDNTELIQPTVLKDDAALATAAQQANGYVKADLTLVMGDSGVKATEINAKQISQWVVLDSDKKVTFNTDAMNAWVQQLVDGLNTVGSTRAYTRADGKAITVTGGSYGWDIDGDTLVQQVTDGIIAGKTQTITVPTNAEGATFTGVGQRDWGLYVDVDITEQHARCYDASNNLLWEADIVSGTPDGVHETPEGVWRIYNKQSPSVLKGDIIQTTGQPEWECTVQYWMAFTASGCGLHDAYWQSAFGGTRYQDGYGSHGCVNLSDSAAAALYNIVKVGNAVVVHS